MTVIDSAVHPLQPRRQFGLVEVLRRLNVPERGIHATLRLELGLTDDEAAAALTDNKGQ